MVNFSTPNIRISINTPKQTQIKTLTSSSQAKVLKNMSDVDASDADNNETLVYDESSGKFVVKEIPIINGGTF